MCIYIYTHMYTYVDRYIHIDICALNMGAGVDISVDLLDQVLDVGGLSGCGVVYMGYRGSTEPPSRRGC